MSRICDLLHDVQQQVAAEPTPQHPVFKAEIEENYPVALRHGGTDSPRALPPDALLPALSLRP